MGEYELMYYQIEMVDGQKMVHYETYLSKNGSCPDWWDEPEWQSSEEPTSVDIVDLTFAYFKASDVARYRESGEFFEWLGEVEELADQYMIRVPASEADDYIDEMDEWMRLDIIDVTEDTPCGCYWSRGWWTFDKEAK